MIIKYDSTFQRNNSRLLGYYHRMMNSRSDHKNIKMLRQDIALTYDIHDNDLIEVNLPFTIDYKQCQTHTQIYIILLDKLGLSKYKYFSEITSISEKKWKNLVKHQPARLQFNQDRAKINDCKNTLIKNKFQSWYECDKYYIKDSIFSTICRLSQHFNPYIWKLLINDLEFNWKSKDQSGKVIYKHPNCIFCDSDWHSNTSPSRHMFENCNILHAQVKINIEPTESQEKIYGKWNLIQISRLADIISAKS